MKKYIKILGLLSVISYTLVTIGVWIYANYTGYTYFQAGEPLSYVKYPEWFLGIIGIFVSADYLRNEIKNINKT